MINKRGLKHFCCEDISLIENYYLAINDETQVWHCHHRKESDENLSKGELINLGLYWKRPAKELIFLTPFEHNSLHHKGTYHTEKTLMKISESSRGKNNGMYGKHHTQETKEKQAKSHLGKSPGNKGKHKVWDNKELNIFHFE